MNEPWQFEVKYEKTLTSELSCLEPAKGTLLYNHLNTQDKNEPP